MTASEMRSAPSFTAKNKTADRKRRWPCGRYSRNYGLFIYGSTGYWDGANFFNRFRLLPFAQFVFGKKTLDYIWQD